MLYMLQYYSLVTVIFIGLCSKFLSISCVDFIVTFVIIMYGKLAILVWIYSYFNYIALKVNLYFLL